MRKNLFTQLVLVVVIATISLTTFLQYYHHSDALPIASSVLPGGRQPITNQTLINELIAFIPQASSNRVCRVTRVVNAQQQIVAGVLYYLIVEVSTSCDTSSQDSSQIFCLKLKIFRPLVTRTVSNPQLQIKSEERVDCNTPL
ncbi:hypothetical protein C9374_002808 [Naegleria lovaniensis]|uniref:Cystatin domain-containing protein n=1 Tax=Naegleria lovaniensis TaxID=51637 RepID=A0AA88GPB0_NAELO|nr:uncharacterized protein C9374_002808 [Naegleria lovaniensis]KAG2386362.1 hypothetical protein C9374_002808 [Naegleria lovaniensis]